MKRHFLAGLLVILTTLVILPVSALAYSYGDANTEDVAETFKLVQSSIGNGANDWNAAESAYQERRAEIISHFGEAVGSTLDANFKAKDSKAVIANFKGVLVMNLDRRFTYAIQGIDDYAASKLLLAKAKATYDTLQPYMSSGKADIEKAFDEALDALGNPGLFGVGKKPVQPDVFKEKVNFIYSKVKPVFPYQAAAAPAATSEPTPVAQPTETPRTEPVVKSEPTAKPDQPVAAEKEAKPTETIVPDAAAAVETKAPEPSASASASPSPSPSPSATPTTEAASTMPAATAAATAAPAKAADTASTTAKQAEPVKEASAHAPMQRTDKTNSFVSIAVIGGVIVLLGGGIWVARKRKWI